MTYPNELVLENNKIKFEIPHTVEISSQDNELTNVDLVLRVNSWVAWLEQQPFVARNIVVNFEHWTPDILCFYMALMITGTAYYAVSEANFTQSNLKEVADRGFDTFIFQARPYNHYDPERLKLLESLGFHCVDFAAQVAPPAQTHQRSWLLDSEKDNFFCFTSGTTGPPKFISHKNRSLLWASTQAAKQFYNAQDTVSLVVMPNHIGVMSMGVMGPIIAGSKIILCFNSDRDFAQKFSQGNKCLMFYYAYLKSFTEIDLRNFDLIITGGEPIRQAFLDLLFAAGVRRVANVYGLTECLPPVATNYFDRAEINYNLGEFTPGVDYRVRHGQLQLRGPNCYLPPGEWKTSGDLVVEHTEGIEFITRDVNSVRIGDHIVVIDRLREFCEQQGLDNFVIRAEEAVYLTVHQKEVILVLYCQEPVALDQLNKKIVTQLGELYRIHMIKDHRSVVRNDISKAVMQ